MNIDIDTTQQAAPAITITDDKHLCDVVYSLASKQLLINSAEAEMQAKVEAAKKAFADATEPLAGEIKELFAAVEAYAEKHKDRLFPVKGGKRAKTFSIMQHKLQYRSSEQVKAPANAVEIIQRIREVTAERLTDSQRSEAELESIRAVLAVLSTLIRTPAPELDKDAVKSVRDKALRDHLAAHGITVETIETFKLAFTFTPNQTA